ncbi:PPOX class F420-dependent oxidoreductase [Nakamurella leprariae]|uniref:PPOX class F420-dependent oxidoreductase n=1 Tax=Nakamurella leprariae TaxID=2803911 RepID=A0A938YA63_9ACTN|nr:PPOX class F420-dependent oxidoreductase [Nakamurella leprariae]MBM9466024.1 PPOX class F420-dependent oxidoreductase [Nakamurella leprariae]
MTVPAAAGGSDLSALAGQRFIALTTFRADGTPVTTPVWVVRAGRGATGGHALVVTTPSGTAKLRRIRHGAGVVLRPCTRFGRIPPGARTVVGEAVIVGDDGQHPALVDRFRAKYGLEYRLFMAVERLSRRTEQGRTLIWIVPEGAAA